MADAVVSFFVQTLGGLITQELQRLYGVHDDLAWIKREYISMEAFLIDAERKRHQDKNVEAWVGDVRHLTFDVEDVIDSFMIKRETQRHLRDESMMHCVAFHVCFIKRLMVRRQFRVQIQSIRKDIKEVSDRRTRYNLQDVRQATSSNMITISGQGDPRVNATFIEEEEEKDIVGTDDKLQLLLSVVNRRRHQRTVISIVGMGGLGKTTLAKKAYKVLKVNKSKDNDALANAWVSVSQSFEIKHLLKEMLRQFDRSQEPVEMSVPDLREKIFKYLHGKQYLLVLDDLWTIDAWKDVKTALPREGQGIIIFTTRNENVADAEEEHSLIKLEPLQYDLAWNLFCRKAFRNNHPRRSCPPELAETAKAIVKRCEGLPLAIVAIGGVMSQRGLLPSIWTDVLQNLSNWESKQNPDIAKLNQVLLTSYNYLPSHLKYCFLYCGLFPEDYSIKRKKLIRLWVAEGFIEEYPPKTLEEVASEYVVQLIQRSMLQPVIDPHTFEVKACRMHDLVRDMAIHKFKEEDFGAVLTNKNENENVTAARRLAIQANEMINAPINTGESNPRSLLMFVEQEFNATSLRSILVSLRLLRVLDLERTKIESTLPDELGDLVLLRYLSLKLSSVKILPASLRRLCHLQTLDIRGTSVTSLPNGALMLLKLKHLLLNRAITDHHLGSMKMMSRLDQVLQTLYCVLPNNVMLVEQLGSLAQMRKLYLIGVRNAYCSQLCASIGKMQHLRSLSLEAHDSDDEKLQLETLSPPINLEKLKLHGRMDNLPQWLGSLHSLQEFSLHGSKLMEDPLSSFLRQLPNLVKLELKDAYTGSELSSKPVGFSKLAYLSITAMEQLILWRPKQEGIFPSIRFLKICDCPELRMIKFPKGTLGKRMGEVSTMNDHGGIGFIYDNNRLQLWSG